MIWQISFLINQIKSSFFKLRSAKRKKNSIKTRSYGQTVQICAKKTKHCATRAGIAPPTSGLPRKSFDKTMYKEHVKFAAFGGAIQPPRSSERGRPSVSLMRLTPHAKPFPTLTAAPAAPSSANSSPFQREPRQVTRHSRLQSRNAPRGAMSAPEREDSTRSYPR